MMLAPDKELPFDPKVFLSNLRTGKADLNYRANAEIYAQGSQADAVYFLVKGMVKIVATTPAGREAVLAIHGPNNFFGDGFLTGRMLRGVTATAIKDTCLIRLEATAMQRLLREQPQFAEFYIAYLIDRKIRTEFSLIDQLVNTSEQRLARALATDRCRPWRRTAHGRRQDQPGNLGRYGRHHAFACEFIHE